MNNFCHTSAGIMQIYLKMSLVCTETHDLISGPKMRHQLLSHVCMNNANPLLKCHWSAVKRSIIFRENGGELVLLYVCSKNNDNLYVFLACSEIGAIRYNIREAYRIEANPGDI